MSKPTKQRVLVICTGNAARSQMAEAWIRHVAGERVEVHSAGTHPWKLHPMVPEVMAEVGVSTEGQYSKSVDEFVDQEFDLVVTVCDSAAESCPVFPGARERLHWPFEDPAMVPVEEQGEVFRRVRDEIGEAVEGWMNGELRIANGELGNKE